MYRRQFHHVKRGWFINLDPPSISTTDSDPNLHRGDPNPQLLLSGFLSPAAVTLTPNSRRLHHRPVLAARRATMPKIWYQKD